MSAYTIAIPVFQSIVTFFVTINFGLATFVNPGAIPKGNFFFFNDLSVLHLILFLKII